MINKAFQYALASVLLAGTGLSWGATAELRGLQIVGSGDSTQVTLDLTGHPREKLFTLHHPDRAVIDLGHTRLARGVRMPSGVGLVKQVRTGTQPGGTLRIVVQLASSVPVRTIWSDAGGVGTRRELVVSLGRRTNLTAKPAAVTTGMSATAAAAGDIGTGAVAAVATRVPADVDTTPKAVRAAHAPAETDRDIVVAVDAGHGGEDPGAIGRNGTREKDVTLAIARALAERINAEPGMKAVLTRDRDEFIVLRDRIRRARLYKADMFVSVHADSIVNRSISGASVYVLSEHGASNEAARWLAERENAADLMGGVKLGDKDNTLASVLLDLSQSANISASMTAAERVLTALDEVGQVRKSQVQQAGFVVLKSPDIPSMLVETAYISNPVEEVKLRTTSQQSRLAAAIFTGIRTYFEANPPAGTRFAQTRRSTVATVMAGTAATAH